VQGVREAIRDRLVDVFGDEWWEKGVEYALQGQLLNALREMVEKNPNHDRHQFIETSHFAWIIVKHHNEVFSDAFSDTVRAFNDLRWLNELRNEWAHRYDIAPARAIQASNIMKSVLASLRREEALEIERMGQEFVVDTKEQEDEAAPTYHGLEHHGVAISEKAIATLEAFRNLQSYLVMDKSVTLCAVGGKDHAEVTITVQNTAPSNIGGPLVYFNLVVVTYLRSQSSNLREVVTGTSGSFGDIYDLLNGRMNRSEGILQLGPLRPGETSEATFSLPVKKLLEVELEVIGVIDSNRLLSFHHTTTLPAEFLGPIQQEFIDRLESVGVREFVNNALEQIVSLDSSMTLSQIATVREEIKAYSSKSTEKRNALAALTGDYGLSRESTIGSRLREIILTLVEFEEKLTALDHAIGQTDLELILATAQNLRQVQLAVIRLEDTLRDMVEGD
jgi:hypothetical protein